MKRQMSYTKECIDCGKPLTGHSSKTKRCHSCAGKKIAKRGVLYKFSMDDMEKGGREASKTKGSQSTQFRKGIQNNKGKKRKINHNQDKLEGHHIWYEDNYGRKTNRGLWNITERLHRKIHVLLRHNHWTDNRRYLAG